jgi:hypothetical protein
MEGEEEERLSKVQTPERVNVKTRPKRGLADLRRRMTDACIDRVRRCDKHALRALLARRFPFGAPLPAAPTHRLTDTPGLLQEPGLGNIQAAVRDRAAARAGADAGGEAADAAGAFCKATSY